jgi:hypothetical protein
MRMRDEMSTFPAVVLKTAPVVEDNLREDWACRVRLAD